MKLDSILDVAVIGAGQSGLSTSYLLHKHKLNHIVLEKGQVGNCWRTQRWDSFVLNSPNAMNLLPDETPDYNHPEAFIYGTEFAERLSRYAVSNQLPVHENSEVISLRQSYDKTHFELTVNHNGEIKNWKAKQVVIAAGAQVASRIPSISHQLPESIYQLHSSEYRNPAQLPEGAVLVVGSATSGVQIAEDLLDAGRKVYLSTSAVARVPRRYRGKDIMVWLADMQIFDKATTDAESFEIDMEAPLMSGVGEFGHTISLQQLYKQGVTLLGYLDHIYEHELTFKNNTAENIRFGDTFSFQIKQGVDQFISATGMSAVAAEVDEADLPDDSVFHNESITTLDCKAKNINSIIWCTGFTNDWKWIKVPVLNEKGEPIHKDGISQVKGLFFMGIPWQRKLKSSLIYGTAEDAQALTEKILQNQTY